MEELKKHIRKLKRERDKIIRANVTSSTYIHKANFLWKEIRELEKIVKEKEKMREFEFVSRITEKDFNLPCRATKNSMAYDFYSPENFELKPGERYLLKTGVKAKMNANEGLILNVRSSMGKKGIMLCNTLGWIDSDFYNNEDNEGEIGLFFYNYGNDTWKVLKNDKIAQGMFINFLTTHNDNATGERAGGFGSTGV